MEYTKEQLDQQFEKMSPDVKEAISSVETTNLIVEIGKENNLHLDQTGDLAYEVGLVMLGLESSHRLASSIKEKLDIDPEQAEKITAEINEKIFLKIRDSIRRIHEEHQKEKNSLGGEKIFEERKEVSGEGEKREEEVLNKKVILEEIENPEKIKDNEPSLGAVKKMEKSLDKLGESSLGENTPISENSLDESETDEEEEGIVEAKLSSPTKLPPKEKEIDPYREPVD